MIWLIVGYVSIAVCIALMLYAWKHRHEDAWWTSKPVAPVIPCESCRQGIAEIGHTSISGAWTCPACGLSHCFVDGQPGKLGD